MDKKYILKKEYTTQWGTLPIGSEITLFRGFVYFNGGMVAPAYADILRKLIDDEKLQKEYLEVQYIQKNEF